jgi:hypothetical protein
MAIDFSETRCGIVLRRLTVKLPEGHLLNALYECTELQQEILKELGKIRHGEQRDASWLEKGEHPSP